jgi:hypothetical protein
MDDYLDDTERWKLQIIHSSINGGSMTIFWRKLEVKYNECNLRVDYRDLINEVFQENYN